MPFHSQALIGKEPQTHARLRRYVARRTGLITQFLPDLCDEYPEVMRILLMRRTPLGILSLVFWSLIIVITVKYVAVIMRADNDGEGGIMAHTAHTGHTTGGTGRGRGDLKAACKPPIGK